ncbi:MAG: beta-lactamase family protein [Acidobacteria bacterium]|nr:beta-lactamase family protein [Acidobacteriota bacterium]
MEKRQFRTLLRLFLFRLIDFDLLSTHAQGDSQRLLGQFASLLIFISLVLSLGTLSISGTQLLNAWNLQHLFIATTMLIVGIFAILSWESTFPAKHDLLILRPLPLQTRTIFAAKISATAAALVLTVVCLHTIPSLIWPFSLHGAPAQKLPALTWLPPLPDTNLDTIAASLQRDVQLPNPEAALAIAVSQRGRSRILTYGAARPDSLFPIGSITKTFTALSLARTALPLHTPLSPQPDSITLLDLATHYSGLPPIPPNAKPDYTADQLAAWLNRRLQRPTEPSFTYSNLGYAALGQFLANRAGLSFPELLTREITTPLQLPDTTLNPTPDQQTRIPQGFNPRWQPVPLLHLEAFAPAGAILSTPTDLLRYLEANLHPPPELAAAIRLAHHPHRPIFGKYRIGLGWIIDTETGIHWHNGAIGGFTSHAFLHPGDNYAAAILFNQSLTPVPFVEQIATHLRQRLSGQPAISLQSIAIPPTTGILHIPRTFLAYWFTMLLAAAFVYCTVLATQGLAAQLLPRGLFLLTAPILQITLLIVLVAGYVLQPAATQATITHAQGSSLLRYSPSYWFLGLLQQLTGSQIMSQLAAKAWLASATVITATAVAYTLSYVNSLKKIVEQPDIPPTRRKLHWTTGSPQWTLVQFTARTLLRSARHRIILAFYLGLGLAITIILMKAPNAPPTLLDGPPPNPWREATTPLIAATIAFTIAWLTGVRIAFSLPIDLRANWIFRLTAVRNPSAIAARSLLALAILPTAALTAIFCFTLWPWREAAAHLTILALATAAAAELSLLQFRKIPFTCSYLPGKSYIHMSVFGALALMWFIVLAARHERDILTNTPILIALLTILAAIALALHTIRKRGAATEVDYEDTDPHQITSLNL